MKTLQLNFKNDKGRKTNFNLKYVDEELSPQAVREAMQKIIDAKLVTDKDGQLTYTQVCGAKYIKREETNIFDDNDEEKEVA